jgi:hypothetical protein
MAVATAFVAHENDKKRSNSTKVNSSKNNKGRADREKKNFRATSANNLVAGLRSVIKNISMHGTELLNRLQG